MVADEVDLTELDCKIFVDGMATRAELITRVAAATGGTADEGEVLGPGLEIFVDDNDEAGGGTEFLFFGHICEVYFAPSVGLEQRVGVVTAILESLWALGRPAVAACDYEDLLPHHGRGPA